MEHKINMDDMMDCKYHTGFYPYEIKQFIDDMVLAEGWYQLSRREQQ